MIISLNVLAGGLVFKLEITFDGHRRIKITSYTQNSELIFNFGLFKLRHSPAATYVNIDIRKKYWFLYHSMYSQKIVYKFMEIELKDSGSLDIQRKRERPNWSPLTFTLLKGTQEKKQLVKGPVINQRGRKTRKGQDFKYKKITIHHNQEITFNMTVLQMC